VQVRIVKPFFAKSSGNYGRCDLTTGKRCSRIVSGDK